MLTTTTWWEGAGNPLQLSGWSVTHVENLTKPDGVRVRIFAVIRTATPRPPVRCVVEDCNGDEFILDGREAPTAGIRIVDAPAAGAAVWWRIRRSRFCCRGCGRKVFEDLPLYVDLHSGMTARGYVHLRRQAANRPYRSVGQELGVSDSFIRSVMKPSFEARRRQRDHQRSRRR